MNRIPGLLVLAVVILAALFLYSNPEVLEKIWLWMIGFIGYLAILFGKGYEKIKDLFTTSQTTKEEKNTDQILNPSIEKFKEAFKPDIKKVETLLESQEVNSLPDSLITILRYIDDGNTTLGLMFINKVFFAYTLEDTHKDEKVPGGTRIPEGHYKLGINPNLSPLTQRYRNRFDWFSNHIEIKGIPNYDLVYIHIGNSHKDTKGCILIADGVNASQPEKMILQSQKAFERFYRYIFPKIDQNEPMAINILNEEWFEKISKTPQLEKA
ncbi:DUF5675 family protein [Cyclobacterium qasimii]|uniref:DUF5675 domain-containing protein n=2 Tax=Cyclobacterium qasimii TaxID=1350429 RepID=S7VHS3_9BACT|nr:DUF5675 family protein [Cyclobacterium qasimii]EPR69087.1 hypothetical protein ADICYQ_1859 [Cyclobacterium qasimii M12-11B]GEO22487.1 hypothetical protein CQA01_30210 [Cyclobacterium qasimii]